MRSNIRILKRFVYLALIVIMPACGPPNTGCANSGTVKAGSGITGGTTSYSITDLGTLGGSNSSPTAINDSLQIVGTADTIAGTHHAFLWQNAKMTDLGTLGGANSTAYAIGSSPADIVGVSDINGGSHHGFLYHNSTMTDLGTLGGGNSSATGILSIPAGGDTIVGVSDTSGSAAHAFSVTVPSGASGNIMLADLGTLGGKNSAAAGEIFGTTIGNSDTSAGTTHAVSVDSNLVLTDLGTLGGANSSALGISFTQISLSQIVGVSDTATTGVSHAFSINYSLVNGPLFQMLDLGTLGGKNSAANAINANGFIVGVSDIASGGQHAFLYFGSVMTDLNSVLTPAIAAKWVLETATGINTAGDIVGTGKIGGVNHAFLLTQQ